jgi:hypothetical protein
VVLVVSAAFSCNFFFIHTECCRGNDEGTDRNKADRRRNFRKLMQWDVKGFVPQYCEALILNSREIPYCPHDVVRSSPRAAKPSLRFSVISESLCQTGNIVAVIQ